MSVSRITYPPAEDVKRLVDWALREDGDGRDLTSEVAVRPDDRGAYALVAREEGVFAGQAVLDGFADRFQPQGLLVDLAIRDGLAFRAGSRLALISGPRRIILQIERPMLNFLQRLCGVATLTQRFVQAAAATSARILDTRKTIPGWRQLDKYAVRCGGGGNHRMGLHDAVLVKDNHLAGVPIQELRRLITDMVARSHRLEPPPAFIEVEVDSFVELAEVLVAGGVDRILLDNFSLQDMRQAVAMRNRMTGKRVELEASGNITIETVADVAQTGVDLISVGSLTHSARALDLALDECGEKI
jgi:nicotinate-nucleotide pyrophosphorylase (carboxylating)